MEEKVYPDLEKMCRLCLKENAGTVSIFNNGEDSNKLSIPMRIMTCASLEVQCSDAFPKKICTECRFQLEKSYYFRKLSQASDAKIRKHLRLIGMGKRSKVFDKKLDEDEYDELEFQDSLNFIRVQEDKQKQMEKLKIDSIMTEMKLQNEEDLKETKERLRTTCREELIPELREQLRKELQTEIKNEIQENLRKEVTEQCIIQAKESLRSELREECRQLEMKHLLDDLQTYLNNKNKSLETSVSTTENVLKGCISSANKNSQKIDVVRMELDLHSLNTEKGNIILTKSRTEDDQNTNDEECDSDGNFLIYDTENFDLQKKSLEDKFEYESNVVQEIVEYEEDEFAEENIVTYEKINDENNEESGEATSTTSYRIEDNADGEIKFLKKCSSDDINSAIDDENQDPKYEYKNIMVINIDEGIENEYVEHFEEVEQKSPENENKLSSTKTKMGPNKKIQASRVTKTTTSSTSETTVLTKTYVNPLQRCTDTPKTFKCDDCPMVFSTLASLERHLRSHRKVDKTGIKYQCPECRIVVSCNSSLRRHMFVHYEKKPFVCNICDKAFVQKEILKRHMQTHTGIKPFQCSHCERSFAQRINLTHHISRAHLNEPQTQLHSCHLCTKRFNHASGLSRHLASHSGVAFQCSECEKTFGDRSSIRRHIVNMHSSNRTLKDDGKAKPR